MNAKLFKHIRLVVVSPGDVPKEREAITRIAGELNRGVAKSKGLQLEVWRWEVDAYPSAHVEGPQGHIDALMDIDDADIVVAVFWKRFGTPTSGSGSGTEHELKRAFNAWVNRQRPQLMVYFNEAAYSPKDQAELLQWSRVLQFRNDLPEELLYWPYVGPEDFEGKAREHLTKAVLAISESPETAKSEASKSASTTRSALPVPQFADAIARPEHFSEIDNLVSTAGVVAIEGLSGGGKTYLIAGYLASGAGRARYDFTSAHWYQPQKGDTVDDLLMATGFQPAVETIGTVARCREYLQHLASSRGVLVIDDFHTVDQSSYAILLELSRALGTPARVIVISTLYTEPETSANPQHLAAPGFSVDEIRTLLSLRKVTSLTRDTLDQLVRQTDGLPIAISLFATLVIDFGHEPEELLQGRMRSSERLRRWFKSITSGLKNNERRLLEHLSICDAPFNRGVVRHLAKGLGALDGEELFDTLQRAYLVQRYTLYSWRVHPLIADFSLEAIERQEVQRVHEALARFFLDGTRSGTGALAREVVLSYQVRACRHLQLAGSTDEAEKLINRIAKPTKAAGLYDLLAQVCLNQAHLGVRYDPWLDYHRAHCLLITGRVREALAVAEPAYRRSNPDTELGLSLCRLCAEALWGIGATHQALARIRDGVIRVEAKLQKTTAWAQAKSLEALLHLSSNDTGSSDAIAQELKMSAIRRNDQIGTAVAFTLLGISLQKRLRHDEAIQSLEYALSFFKDANDRRGVSWTQINLGITKYTQGLNGSEHVIESIDIRSRIGECSREYRDQLRQLIELAGDPSLLSRLNGELARVESALRV